MCIKISQIGRQVEIVLDEPEQVVIFAVIGFCGRLFARGYLRGRRSQRRGRRAGAYGPIVKMS